jgi:hypothetical protein
LHFGADRIKKKSSTGKSPFELVYGLDVTLPVHLKLLVYQFVQKYGLDEDFHQNRIEQIIELDENRRKALDQSIRNQEKIKRTLDKSSRQRDFQPGDTVLLWNKRREKPRKSRQVRQFMGRALYYPGCSWKELFCPKQIGR